MAATEQATDEREALRGRVHRMWAGVAARWADYADEVDERSSALTRSMLDRVALRPDDRVLELACGPGGAGLAAAAQPGRTGEVVLSDVAAEMAAIAAARATARGLDRVRSATLDLEQIAEPDASYDVVLCREGLMFAVEPERAVQEIRRVLRPGGRAAVAVWGPKADNPWLGVLFDAVSEQTGLPIPPPGVPGPFSLDDPARLQGMLTEAGFVDVSVDEVPVPLRVASFETWWIRTRAIAGPLASILAGLPDPVNEAISARLRDAVAPYTGPSGLEMPGISLLASACRP